MTRRAPRHARRAPETPPGREQPGRPVNPGAWDARSWVLATPEPVVWPEAGSADVPAAPPAARRVTPPPPSPADRLADPPPRREPPHTVRRRAGAAPLRPAAPPAAATEAPAPGPSASAGVPSADEAEGRPADAGRWPEAGRRQSGPSPTSDGADAGGVAGRGPVGDSGAAGTAAAWGGRSAPSPGADVSAGRSADEAAGRRPAARGGAAGAAPVRGRGSADPVRALMRRHRELCEQAVDPLEIAAGLEAHGVTDRTAARFRHRDVFSLAEEMFARVPRAEAAPSSAPEPDPAASPGGRRGAVARAAVPLLPGLLCTVGVAVFAATDGVGGPALRLGVGLATAGAVLTAAALAARGLPWTRTTVLWACWLLAYALLGDGALSDLLAGGRGPAAAVVRPDLSVALTLAFAVAPAAWCGRWFVRRAGSRLPASRSLGDFAAGVRPLLAAAVVLFVAALALVQAAVRLAVATVPMPGTARALALPHDPVAVLTAGQHGWQLGAALTAEAALAVLFFTAALLAAHGAPGAATAGLAAACAVELAAVCGVLASRVPGLGLLDRPVAGLAGVAGPEAVPALACAAATVGLLVQAARVLAAASAHQGRRGW